jgi:hypothetical protein
MNRVPEIVFIAFFLVVIFVVGIAQAIVEIRGGDEVQMGDLFVDTFVTPVKRENAIAELFDKLRQKNENIESMIAGADADPDWDVYDVEILAEEALFLVQDIRKEAETVNRHMNADTTARFFRKLDTLRQAANALYEAALDEQSAETLYELHGTLVEQTRAAGKGKDQVRPVEIPGLAFDHFFRYTAFQQGYLRKWEAEMEDVSLFANTLRPPMQFVRFALLHDGGEKAVLGRDGWYFYKPGYDYLVRPYMRDPRSIVVDPNDKPLVDNPIKAITTFQKQLNDQGVELLVVVVPGKPSVYPEMLAENFDTSRALTFSHSMRAMEDLRDAGIEVVDLFTPFKRERLNDAEAGDSLYLKKDTHWRARGLRLAAATVAERVKQYPWYRDGDVTYEIDSVTVDRVGDVGTMTTLPAFKIRELNLGFDVEKTKCYQVFDVQRDSVGEVVSRRPYRDDYSSRSDILLLGDSFSRIYQTDAPRSAGWISHLAYHLKQPLSTIVNDGGASTLVRQTLSRKSNLLRGKKLVIWEFVERDFRYGAEGWKDVEL